MIYLDIDSEIKIVFRSAKDTLKECSVQLTELNAFQISNNTYYMYNRRMVDQLYCMNDIYNKKNNNTIFDSSFHYLFYPPTHPNKKSKDQNNIINKHTNL